MNRRLLREIIRREIREAISLQQAKKAMRSGSKRSTEVLKRLKVIFSKLSKMKGAKLYKNKKTGKVRDSRIYFPFGRKIKLTTSWTSTLVLDYLKSLGYTDFEYVKNLCKNPKGQRMKISKALVREKRKDLLAKFNKDDIRENANATEFMICFSKHPYDIAGMSSGRGWEGISCMNLTKSQGKHFVPYDITEGTVVVYLIKRLSGQMDYTLQSPVARVLIKPFVSADGLGDIAYFSEKKVYGTAPSTFEDAARKIFHKVSGQEFKPYEYHCELYKDNQDDYEYGVHGLPDDATQDQIDFAAEFEGGTPKEKWCRENFIDYEIDEFGRINVYGHVTDENWQNCDDFDGTEIPYEFGTVEGMFQCSGYNLKTLRNTPMVVQGDFDISYNRNLRSLADSPNQVGGDINIDGCEMLEDFKGMPRFFGGVLHCSDTATTKRAFTHTIYGEPYEINGNFIEEYESLFENDEEIVEFIREIHEDTGGAIYLGQTIDDVYNDEGEQIG